MELKKIHRDVLADCTDDDVALGHIIWRFHGGAYELDNPEFISPRGEVLEIISTLLDRGLVEAGVFEGTPSAVHVFVPLAVPASEAVAYIQRAWMALGRAPQIGEICWFRATPVGKKLAQDLDLKAH